MEMQDKNIATLAVMIKGLFSFGLPGIKVATLEKMAKDAGFRYKIVAKYQWHQLAVCYKGAH